MGYGGTNRPIIQIDDRGVKNLIGDTSLLGTSPQSLTQTISERALNVRDFGASGSGLSTTGSIIAGSAILTVGSVIDFVVGQGISVAGAGTSGALLVSTVSKISGTTITLSDAAGTTVSSAAIQHDDTQKIKDAITSAGDSGGIVYLPHGTYVVSSRITIDSTTAPYIDGFVGEGLGTVLQPTGFSDFVLYFNLFNQTIGNFYIYNSAKVKNDGIYIQGAILNVFHVRVMNMIGYGIKFDTVWDSVVTNVHTENCGDSANSKASMLVDSASDTTNECLFNYIQVEEADGKGLEVTTKVMTCIFNRVHGEQHGSTTVTGTSHILNGYRCEFHDFRLENYETLTMGGSNNLYTTVLFINGTTCIISNGTRDPMTFMNCYFDGTTTANSIGRPSFRDCVFNVLQIGDEYFKLENCYIASYIGLFTAGVKNYVIGCKIDAIDMSSTAHKNIDFISCEIGATSITNIPDSVHFLSCDFKSDLTFTDKTGKADKCTFSNVSLNGNATNFIISFSTITGNVTQTGTGYEALIYCSVTGTVASGVKQVALP